MNGEATRDKLCKGLALDIRNNNQYFNIKKRRAITALPIQNPVIAGLKL